MSRAINLDPYDEFIYQRLMQVYADSGKPLKAGKVYSTLRDILLNELGVSPMPATQNLYDSILLNANTELSSGAGLGSKTQHFTESSGPLVGREKLFAACFDTLCSRRYRMVLVESTPGLGRSSFASLLLAKLSSTKIIIRCEENPDPYFPLKRAMLELWHDSDFHIEKMQDKFKQKNWEEICVFVPYYALGDTNSKSAQDFTPDTVLDIMLNIILFLSSEDDTTIFVDDIEKAPEELLYVLHGLIKYLSSSKVRFIVTKNSATPLLSIEKMVQELSSKNLLYRAKLDKLSEEDSCKLVKLKLKERDADTILSDQQNQWLFQRTGGNPKALNSFAGYIAANSTDKKCIETLMTTGFVPTEFVTYISCILHELPKTARDFLRYASACGYTFVIASIYKAMQPSQADCIDAIETLLKTSFFKKQDNMYAFDYPILADAIYQDLSPFKKQLIHERIAQTLVQQEDEQDTGTLRGIVFHYSKSTSPSKGFDYAVKFASVSLSNASWSDAEYFLEYIKKSPLHYYAFQIEMALLQADFSAATDAALTGYKLDLKFQLSGSPELFNFVATLCQWQCFKDFFSGCPSPEYVKESQELTDAVAALKPFLYNLYDGANNSFYQMQSSFFYGLYNYLRGELRLALETLSVISVRNAEAQDEACKRLIAITEFVKALCTLRTDPEAARKIFSTGLVYTRNNNLISTVSFYNSNIELFK